MATVGSVARRYPPNERQLVDRLAANVRRLRLARGLTLQAASERAQMHLRLWEKVEAGATSATLQTIARLAAALDVDARELLDPPAARRG